MCSVWVALGRTLGCHDTLRSLDYLGPHPPSLESQPTDRPRIAMCNAVKAAARVTPLTSLQRPQACLPSGGTSHTLLLATTSQFGLARLKAIPLSSIRLAGAARARAPQNRF